jgi:hypothetical protein
MIRSAVSKVMWVGRADRVLMVAVSAPRGAR